MKTRYLAYMLRLWSVGDSRSAVWRFSLENPHTGDRYTFASLEALLAFLESIAGSRSSAETGADDIGNELHSKNG